MRLVALAAALLFAVPSSAQVPVAVSLTHFSQQSGGSVPGATSLFSVSATITSGQTAGFMMLFRGQTIPPDGPVNPEVCFYVDTGPNTASLSMGGNPGSAPTGFVWAFSTAANCQTKHAAVVNFVSIAYR